MPDFFAVAEFLLRYFALAGHVMAVISSGRWGDQVTLTSVLHEFEEDVSVYIDYHLQESKPGSGGTLSVYLLSKQRVPMRVNLRELHFALNGGWKRGCFYIPRGTYHVMFLGTLGVTYHSDIYLDKIELQSKHECRHIIKQPTGNIIFLLGERVNHLHTHTHTHPHTDTPF